MKTIIPKQPKVLRERIEVKLDAQLVKKLDQYCRYLDSDKDYVLGQALELIFRKDKGFQDWSVKQGVADPAAAGTPPSRRPMA